MAPLVSFSCIWRTDSADMSRNFLGQLFLGQSKIFDNIFGILTKIAARRAFFPREMELFLMGFLDNLLKNIFISWHQLYLSANRFSSLKIRYLSPTVGNNDSFLEYNSVNRLQSCLWLPPKRCLNPFVEYFLWTSIFLSCKFVQQMAWHNRIAISSCVYFIKITLLTKMIINI